MSFDEEIRRTSAPNPHTHAGSAALEGQQLPPGVLGPVAEDERAGRVMAVLLAYGALPFAASIRNFSDEEVKAGLLREADDEAERMNHEFVLKVVVAAAPRG